MPTYVAGEKPKSVPQKVAKKVLHHIEVHEAESGGHMIVHHFDNSHAGPMHESEHHVFGRGEGGMALAHIAKVMHIPGGEEEAVEPEHKGMKEPVEIDE